MVMAHTIRGTKSLWLGQREIEREVRKRVQIISHMKNVAPKRKRKQWKSVKNNMTKCMFWQDFSFCSVANEEEEEKEEIGIGRPITRILT